MTRNKNGWIKLYSTILDKSFSPIEFKIWVGLLLIANSVKSRDSGVIDLPQRTIAKRLDVSLGALVQARNKFVAEQRIEIVKLPWKTRPIMGIRILNFDLYQSKEFVSQNEQTGKKIVLPSGTISRLKTHQRITENNTEIFNR